MNNKIITFLFNTLFCFKDDGRIMIQQYDMQDQRDLDDRSSNMVDYRLNENLNLADLKM